MLSKNLNFCSSAPSALGHAFCKTLVVVIGCLAIACQAESLRLVTGEESFPPYSDPNLPNGGLITQIVRTVFDKMGHSTEIEYLPWVRGYLAAKEGNFTGTFPYVKNGERVRFFYYSYTLAIVVDYFFVKKNSKIVYQRDEDLKGLVVCRPIGYSRAKTDHLQKRRLAWIWQPESLQKCFELLDDGKVDLVPISKEIAKPIIKRRYGDPEYFSVLDKAAYFDRLHFIISRNYPNAQALMKKFNTTFLHLLDDGSIRRIYKKYGQIFSKPDLQVIDP